MYGVGFRKRNRLIKSEQYADAVYCPQSGRVVLYNFYVEISQINFLCDSRLYMIHDAAYSAVTERRGHRPPRQGARCGFRSQCPPPAFDVVSLSSRTRWTPRTVDIGQSNHRTVRARAGLDVHHEPVTSQQQQRRHRGPHTAWNKREREHRQREVRHREEGATTIRITSRRARSQAALRRAAAPNQRLSRREAPLRDAPYPKSPGVAPSSCTARQLQPAPAAAGADFRLMTGRRRPAPR